MDSYFVPHRLSIGDTTHLSDSDSELIISGRLHKVEDIVGISTHEALFRAVITDIGTASVEVEILEELEQNQERGSTSITLIQSISGDRKFNFLLEKAVEIGITKIIPAISTYSTLDLKKARNSMDKYQRIISEATEQSRNPYPTVLADPLNLKDLVDNEVHGGERICLVTENVMRVDLT